MWHFDSFTMGSFGWFSMFLGAIFMILFWGLLIWLIFVLINRIEKGPMKENEYEILRRRYAKGEITKKQYEEIKKELRR